MVVAKVEVPVTTKELVVVELVALRLVANALVVVELPITALVIEARVATSDEMKEFVLVLLDESKSVKLPFVAAKLVV